MAEHAAALLTRIPDTLPTYTLHDRQHAENVITLMEHLLGEHIEALTPLEAGMLILSAYFHDIGMVFTEAERMTLRDIPDFDQYLRGHPGALLAISKAHDAAIPSEVTEGYCRWAHPNRAANYLQSGRLPCPFNWNGIDLTPYLAAVCRSHGYDAKELRDDEKFPTEFLAECDLRLCALLLRLADIMDFDRSRSPEAVYGYLGLADSTAPRDRTSDLEWRKNYSSGGFRFPEFRSASGYALDFICGPDDPGVERDIREFLDVIEEELRVCGRLLQTCAGRWRDLPLPGNIRRDNIRSQGYIYGPYRFEMSRLEVLQLFTGENLYASPYAFVRELLQNALDASRDRAFAEEARTGRQFTSSAVRVRDWRDSQGRLWVEFTDDGRGMDGHILLDYFLQIGRSYYTSEEFEAELLSYQYTRGRKFRPISRFGIGVLSCFIVADRVELSTLRSGPGMQPIRLSMWGRDGFYALQTPPQHLVPKPMPGRDYDQIGYRTSPGTTIAVRFDPYRERGDFDLNAELRKHVAFPTVAVEHQGERVGYDPAQLVTSYIPEPLSIELTEIQDEFEWILEDWDLAGALDGSLTLRLTPINFSTASPSPDCQGQFIGLHIEGIPWGKIKELLKETDGDLDIGLSYNKARHELSIEMTREFTDERVGETWNSNRSLEVKLDSALIDFPSQRDHVRELLRMPDWSHNGIYLPQVNAHPVFPALAAPNNTATKVYVGGHVSLRDHFRPDVDVSRDSVRGTSWETCSVINLTYRRAVKASGLILPAGKYDETGVGLVRASSSRVPFDLHTLIQDPLIQEDGGWSDEPIVRTPEGLKRIGELRDRMQVKFPVYSSSVIGQSRSALLALKTQLTVSHDGGAHNEGTVRITDMSGHNVFSPGEFLFPPLTFINFDNSIVFYARSIGINRNHPLAVWLVLHAEILNKRFPAIFSELRKQIIALPQNNQTTPKDPSLINALLGQLADLEPELWPSPPLFLRPDDFGLPSVGKGQ